MPDQSTRAATGLPKIEVKPKLEPLPKVDLSRDLNGDGLVDACDDPSRDLNRDHLIDSTDRILQGNVSAALLEEEEQSAARRRRLAQESTPTPAPKMKIE